LDGADLQQFLPQRSRGLTILPPSETAGDTLHEDGQSGSKKNNLGEISPELFYRAMYDLKQEIGEIKFAIANLSQLIARGGVGMPTQPMPGFYPQLGPKASQEVQQYRLPDEDRFADGQEMKAEESLSIEEKEQDLIEKALIRHNKNRKKAAQELGISERTLYRKIKSYGLE
jgi:DNA-binding NtrC family response regulator